MEVCVYEHVSGGGYAGRELPGWGLAEGYSMLATLLEDFKSLGCKVSTLLDSRVKAEGLKADVIKKVDSSLEAEGMLEDLVSKADVTMIVAPEHDGVLSKLVRLAEKHSPAVLNCPSTFFKKLPGKAEILEALKAGSVRTPETLVLESPETSAPLKGWTRFPAAVKPSLGAGCLGLSLAPNRSRLEEAVKHAWKASPSKILVQRFVEGLHGSLLLLASSSEAEVLSLNLQILDFTQDGRVKYLGGLTPLPLRESSAVIAEGLKAAETLISNLKGFIGIDFVLAEGEPWIIEVNPRITTSYLGLRKTLKDNPARLLLEACLKGRLPRKVRTEGFAVYLRAKPSRLTEAFECYSPTGVEGMAVLWSESLENLLSKAEKLNFKFSLKN
ncbi:MAG: ATP-grasp domain-containing protein [Candidatus Hecatellaceae archaeon]|nr:MAG: hypothetical protein DRO43_04110 [Candidatus Hecatellales archaeon]